MSNIFKKALGVLIEIDEETKETNPNEVSKIPSLDNKVTPVIGVTTPNPVNPVNTVSYTPTTFNTQPSIDQESLTKFSKHFDELLDKSNFVGPDYLEFSRMSLAMGNALPIETKMQVTFMGLQSQDGKLTKQKLIDTAKEYIKILETDEQNFNKSIDENILSQVNDKESLIQNKTQEILNIQEQIKQLNQKTIDLNNDIIILNNESNELKLKANSKQTSFNMVLQQYKNNIINDIKNIETYLPNSL